MSSRTRAGIVVLCLAVTLLAAVASGLGVFDRGDGSTARATSVLGQRYEYVTTGIYQHNTQRVVAEGVGWDLVTLFVVVPGMLLTLPSVARGSLRGRLVAAGWLGYLFYQYLMYAVAWTFGPLFVVFILIYAGSLAGVAWLASTMRFAELRDQLAARFPAKGMGAYATTMSVLLVLMWAARIAATYRGDLTALYGLPTLPVQALDLGIVVPLGLFVGISSWLRKPVAYLFAPVFAVKAFGMSAGIAAMVASAAIVEGRLEAVPFAIFAVSGIVAGWLCVTMLRKPETLATPASAEGSPALRRA